MKVETPDPVICDKCGKNMAAEAGSLAIGMTVQVSCTNPWSDAVMQKQFGKYELGREYRICFECLIDNMLGVGAKSYTKGAS